MSLADLPDVLIVHLTNYLDYDDICNLMETSKKNYNSIKSYNKDKIKLYLLSFPNFRDELTVVACDAVGRDVELKNWNEIEGANNKIKQVIDESASIDELYLDRTIFNTELLDFLMTTKAKIGTLYLDWEPYLTEDDNLKLCRKFHVVFDLDDGDSAVLNDEILTKILSRSTIRNWSSNVIGTIDAPMNITNITLNALISGNKVQAKFSLRKVHNSITVKELVKVIKILHERNKKVHLLWCLGILHSNQAVDANRYFGENGETKEICDSSVVRKTGMISYHVSFIEDNWGGHNCRIHFKVAFPRLFFEE